MPTYARGQIVVEDMVGVYHCIARCVRRAFLCGIDPYTGQDYSHRKEWILDRLRDLAGLFAIEISTRSTSKDENSPLKTCERPDAWLCELTLQETATKPASTTAVDAASPRRESATAAGPVAIAALPQAVNRTGTTPCCKARSRFPISRRSRALFASSGRNRIASRDNKRSDRRKVWVCFR
jgi:hypothetical protein